MQWKKNILLKMMYRATFPICIAHELCHYSVARLLGVRARLFLTEIRVEPGTRNWQLVVIALAPAAAGVGPLFLAAGYTLFVAETWIGRILGLELTVLFLAWLGCCRLDFRGVWHIVRHGRWPPGQSRVDVQRLIYGNITGRPSRNGSAPKA
ncbi:MAG: hypothetical protein L0332_25495 [Chloroflexi bacterium]|nr:hypothetical protein [Chloroflexota bacterium]MCI0730053.1 hypothetical protein [Chloroflexota bacterium]